MADIDRYIARNEREFRFNPEQRVVEILEKYDLSDEQIQRFSTRGVNLTSVIIRLIEQSRPDVAKMYIKRFVKLGADINTRREDGFSRLFSTAFDTQDIELIKVLLDSGFVVTDTDIIISVNQVYVGSGKWILPNFNILKLLLDHTKKLSDDYLPAAIYAKNMDAVKLFIDKGLTIKKEDLDQIDTTPEIKKFVEENTIAAKYKKATPGIAQLSVSKQLPPSITANIASMLSPTGKPPKSYLPKTDTASREAIQAEKEAVAAMRTGGQTRKRRGKKTLKSKRKISKK